MYRLSSFQRTVVDLRAGVLAVLALLVILLPAGAQAAGCTDSWTNTAGGSWFTATNWSTKAVPGSTEEACITAAGTYTVELNGATVSLKALTVGGSSGTQTLSVASTNSANTQLTTTAGITDTPNGAITLTNTQTSGNSVTIVGPVSNAGSITTEKANGGQRVFQGSLTNTGTIAVNAGTNFNASKAALTNEGAIDIATGVSLVASAESSLTNGAGGKIVATGSGDVAMEPGTTFTEGAGTTSGTKPVVLRQAALAYTGGGASLITQHGEGSTLTGNLSSGQALVLESTNSEHVKTTAAVGFTNAGMITLTNSETSANNATLTISSGTLTNSGSITTEAAVGGARVLQGSLTNTGTLTINQNTTYNSLDALLTNEGAINIAASKQLLVSNDGSVTNGSGGSIAAGENGDLFLEPGSTFTEGAGTTSGTKPVVLRQAALSYTGSGASVITQHGEGSTLTGSLSPGQALVLESTNGENEKTTAAATFTNAGKITLTNSETSANNAALLISSGTLTNSGTITTEKAHGGARSLQGNLTNTGTLAINATTSYNGSEKTLTNAGAINIATGVALDVTGLSTFSNESGGMIATTGSGVFLQTEGTFNEGLGKTTVIKKGEPVVLLDRVTLNYTNKGASKIAQRGASKLSGTINKGQTLVIESTNSENAEDTAAGSFLNSGTIELSNAETSGNNAILKLAGGTLQNKGTVNILFPHGGARTIEGSLNNEKTLSIANGSGQSLKVTGGFSSGTKATMKLIVAGSAGGGNYSKLAVSGAAAIAGKLSLKQLKFTAKAGESFAIIFGASRSGEFASVKGNTIKKTSLHYLPAYTGTGVDLQVE